MNQILIQIQFTYNLNYLFIFQIKNYYYQIKYNYLIINHYFFINQNLIFQFIHNLHYYYLINQIYLIINHIFNI